MRCLKCGRALLRFAASFVGADGIEVGYGPICGAQYIVIQLPELKRRRTKSIRNPRIRPHNPDDDRQQDWIGLP